MVGIGDWTRQKHIHPCTLQRWFEGGSLPVPARRLPSATVPVEGVPPQVGKVARCARVASLDQRSDLDRQLGRSLGEAASHDLTVDLTVPRVARE